MAGPRLLRARHETRVELTDAHNCSFGLLTSAGEHLQPQNPDVRLPPVRRSLIFWTCMKSKLWCKFRDGCSGSCWDAATGTSEMHLSDNEIIHALILQGGSNKYAARTVAPLLCFSPLPSPSRGEVVVGGGWGGGGVVHFSTNLLCFAAGNGCSLMACWENFDFLRVRRKNCI